MGITILTILLVSASILIVQNLQPISLIFFSLPLPWSLPLGLWILLFVLAGLLTSLFWQLLLPSPKKNSNSVEGFYVPKTDSLPPKEPKKTIFTRETPPESTKKAETTYQRDPDWEQDKDDDWNIEETAKKTEIQNQENPPEPKTTAGFSSVYSYKYRSDEEPKSNKREDIYDANYRVIKPPTEENKQDSINTEDDDEEWV